MSYELAQQQHRAVSAYLIANNAQDRETMISLLTLPFELPVTANSLEMIVTPSFPDGDRERQACWRLLREAAEQADGRGMQVHLRLLKSAAGAKLLAKILHICHFFNPETARLLAGRPDVLRRAKPATVHVGDTAAARDIIAQGFGNCLVPETLPPGFVEDHQTLLCR